jgi:hypothetical protein
MIVILEGPDGAGKTTLAEQLAKKYGLVYKHEGPPPPKVNVLEYYGQLLDEARGKNVVFDRLALGERVYGPVYRNLDRLGADGWLVFKRLIFASGALHIVCLPTFEICFSNWDARKAGEMIKDEGQYRRIWLKYCELVMDDIHYQYNYREVDAWDNLCFCLDTMQSVETPSLPFRFVGHPNARYLLVGDTGSNAEATIDLPFFATVNSSKFLTEALHKAGYKEEEVAMVNAYRHGEDKHRLVKAEIQQFPVVIALGGRAADALRELDLPFQQVPHPQYWKRFHRKDIDVYPSFLRTAKI